MEYSLNYMYDVSLYAKYIGIINTRSSQYGEAFEG